MKSIFLSHILSNNSPTYGNSGLVKISKCSDIKSGDSCNKSELHIDSHVGTHIDAPYHFDRKGFSIEEYDSSFWICINPYVINYQAKPKEIINIDNLKPKLLGIPSNTDILIIKTNFGQFRSIDPEKYIFSGPGIDPNLGSYLRKNTNIKMIGFDFISLSSYSNRALGRKSHIAFLSKLSKAKTLDPILLIEDMDLTNLSNTPSQIIVSPIRFKVSDGAPVTVIGLL